MFKKIFIYIIILLFSSGLFLGIASASTTSLDSQVQIKSVDN
jgi:phosphotransferase system  glucose/maltose/N-acetylglucosamine-specific IIC component